MSLNLKNIVIDADKTLGKGLMLVDAPRPAYLYTNGTRTEEVVGQNYQILVPNLSFEKISVKVGDTQPIISAEDWQSGNSLQVAFSNLKLQLSQNYKDHALRLFASADTIRLVEQKG